MSSVSIKKTAPRAVGEAINDRVAKLGLYRECLRLAHLAEKDVKGTSTLNDVRQGWRRHAGDGGILLECSIASCIDRISYMRMCLCKQRCKMIPAASEKYKWDVQNPMDNQTRYHRKRHENQGSFPMSSCGGGNRDFVPITNWGFGNIDPDMKKLQKETMDHQYFKGPHWRGKVKPQNVDDLSFEESAMMYGRGQPKIPKTPKKHF